MDEDKARKDAAISQINAVIQNLKQIKQNQYMLRQQVKGHTLHIAQCAALTAYYAALPGRSGCIPCKTQAAPLPSFR